MCGAHLVKKFAPAERPGAGEVPPHLPSAAPAREAKTFLLAIVQPFWAGSPEWLNSIAACAFGAIPAFAGSNARLNLDPRLRGDSRERVNRVSPND